MNRKLQIALLTTVSIFLIAFLAGCGTQIGENNSPTANYHNSNAASNNVTTDHGQMDHSTMQSSPHAEHAEYDLQFIDTMIVHHQGAVDMARECPAKARSANLTKLCSDITSSQTKEIAQMRAWRDAWFKGNEPAVNMQLAGMAESMKGMDMNKLGSLTGEAYDVEFIQRMIPHHVGAVEMSKEALSRSTRPEIKTLAEGIITAQESEIDRMKSWLPAK